MNRLLNFSKRNFKEVLRDPIIYIFCLGFPIIMLILFQIINSFTNGNTPMFNLNALLPAIIMFSFTFIMLLMSLIVSKDRQTSFLKRLYSSPMKPVDFILGYALVGFVIGMCQSVICIFAGFIISLITNVAFISFGSCLLLIISQIPVLLINIFLGILIGTICNDKTAPGISSVFISLSGMLGGCWMPIEAMGAIETFCLYLPFYPSVYIGKIITGATNSLGTIYSFNSVAKLGLIPIFATLIFSVVLCCMAFKNTRVSDK